MQDDRRKILEEQFLKLPKVVQDAITSGHVAEKFQALVGKYKLHVDTWDTIENLIMLTVLGISPPEELVNEIVSATGISAEIAVGLVEDVAETVFRPIREELERELGHPEARKEELSEVEKVREEVLAQGQTEGARQKALDENQAEMNKQAAVAVTPGTPPPAPPTKKVIRMPASGAYKPGEPSTARADVHDDPYREPPA